MPYVFCLLVDVARCAAIAYLGYLIHKGATAWLVLVMVLLASSLILPGSDLFTCPECGHTAHVKVYKQVNGSLGVQKKDESSSELPNN